MSCLDNKICSYSSYLNAQSAQDWQGWKLISFEQRVCVFWKNLASQIFYTANDFESSCLSTYIPHVPKIAMEKVGPNLSNENLLVIVWSESILIRFSRTSGFQKLKILGKTKSVIIYFSFAQVGTVDSLCWTEMCSSVRYISWLIF